VIRCLFSAAPHRIRASRRFSSVISMKLRSRRPSVASVIALVALFVALGGPAEAAKLINGKLIKAGTIRSKQVKNRSLSTVELSSAAVRSLMRTPASSITATQLAPGAVTADRLAGSSVTSAAIADDTVTAADIAAGAVGNSELATSAVTRSKIASNGVGASEITANAVTSSEVADGQLTGADVGTFTGTFSSAIALVPPQSCTGFPQDVTPIVAGADITDDAILVTPGVGFPDSLTVVARPVSPTSIRVSICNPTSSAVDPVASQSFRFVAFAA
jgi:hypothetical protein